jgi:putative tricarboxylic transport membrane protein
MQGKNMDTRRDLVIALAVAALGAGILWMTGSIKMGIARDVIGPRAFPYAIGTLLLAGGLVLALRRLRFMNVGGGFVAPEEGTEDTEGYPASAGRVLFIMALSVAYLALLMPVGYLIATPPFVALAFVAMGERKAVYTIVIPIIWTVLTFLLFSQLLDVRMPVGPFTPLFRGLGLILL